MALTDDERERLETLEDTVVNLAHLVKGAGSRNQLNRLVVLAQDKIDSLTTRLLQAETKMTELLELVRKLQ